MSQLIVHAPAQITKIQTLADNTIQTVASHPELPPDEMAILFQLRKSQGWWMFAANKISTKDIPEEPALESSEKKPSARLRAVLFIFWTQLGSKGDFDAFYKARMEGFINQIKEQLE